ncbi:shikimate kinase [Lacinutrix chionoecetis]
MNIVLIGYMASGKSFIGKELAKVLGFKFIDLDDVIELKEKRSLSEIFSESGEIYFRKKEKQYLDSLLKTSINSVISLGGGTPCYFNTMDSLISKPKIKTVYLNVSIPVLVDRLREEKSKRPLIAHIKSDELLTEFIGKHLFERALFYNKAAYTINANRNVNEIVEDIVLQLF